MQAIKSEVNKRYKPVVMTWIGLLNMPSPLSSWLNTMNSYSRPARKFDTTASVCSGSSTASVLHSGESVRRYLSVNGTVVASGLRTERYRTTDVVKGSTINPKGINRFWLRWKSPSNGKSERRLLASPELDNTFWTDSTERTNTHRNRKILVHGLLKERTRYYRSLAVSRCPTANWG